jgi:hypothetical protein
MSANICDLPATGLGQPCQDGTGGTMQVATESPNIWPWLAFKSRTGSTVMAQSLLKPTHPQQRVGVVTVDIVQVLAAQMKARGDLNLFRILSEMVRSGTTFYVDKQSHEGIPKLSTDEFTELTSIIFNFQQAMLSRRNQSLNQTDSVMNNQSMVTGELLSRPIAITEGAEQHVRPIHKKSINHVDSWSQFVDLLDRLNESHDPPLRLEEPDDDYLYRGR